jgi:protein-tyrosine-phosphatase
VEHLWAKERRGTKRGTKFVGKKEGGFMAVAKQKPKVVFVCLENARRSQMAEGFANAFGQGKVEVYSGGSRPSSQIDPLVIEVMKEKGIDLSGKRPKGLNEIPPIEMDYLITMGCEETCPAVLTKKIIEWEIPDPKGKPIYEVRRIRDMLEVKVKMLLEEVES